jgi:hypothetical protein
MTRPLATVIAEIEHFAPGADGSWLSLDALLQEAATCAPDLAPAVEPLLRLFERFPRHDGFEVFWSVIHLVESIPGYESALVDSVKRCPTEMGATMLRRLVRSGVERVGDVELPPLVAWASSHAPKIDHST